MVQTMEVCVCQRWRPRERMEARWRLLEQEGRPRARAAARAPSQRLNVALAPTPPQGIFKFKQYQVVGRHLPTDSDPSPTLYRMKVWASDAVRARSKFW